MGPQTVDSFSKGLCSGKKPEQLRGFWTKIQVSEKDSINAITSLGSQWGSS